MTLSHAIMASPPALSKALFLDSISQMKWLSTHISSWHSKSILSWKGGKGTIKNNGMCCWGQMVMTQRWALPLGGIIEVKMQEFSLKTIWGSFLDVFSYGLHLISLTPMTRFLCLSALETALNTAISMVVPCLQLSQGISCRDTSSKDWAAVYKH